jgi:hypothetical protein
LRAARKTHGYHIHHSSEVSSSRSSSTSATPASRPPVGQWPAQAPRRVEPVVHPAVDATPSAPTEQPTSANSPPAKISTVPEMPAGLAVRPSYFAGTAGAKKQTMESFMPTPVQARSTMSSASPGKATLPAWAGPLEKALADGASMKSVPPHLRKPTSNEYPRAQQVIKLAPSDTNERDSSNLGARFEVAVEASRRVSDSSIVKEKGENGGLLPHTAKQVSLYWTPLLFFGLTGRNVQARMVPPVIVTSSQPPRMLHVDVGETMDTSRRFRSFLPWR